VPALNVCFASAGAAAGGLSLALEAQYDKGRLYGEKPTVFTWVGDGGTYDIGLQGLSAAAERNDDFIHICYNNEAYSNTGMQRSGATPMYAVTTTTPLGKENPRKNLAMIMLQQQIPYMAIASLSYPMDLYRKVAKAKSVKGFKYIEIHAPCAPGWKFASADTVEIGRLAVRSGAWLLWEAENGQVTVNPPTSQFTEGKAQPIPMIDYISEQGRFAHLLKRDDRDAVLEEMHAAALRDIRSLAALAGNGM
jgi:pyruvate ferredoxin oxidoreductase beta subunit